MKTLEIQIDETVYQKFLGFIKLLPEDKIKVIEDSEDIFTEDLKEIKEEAIKDLKRGNTIDWNDLKKELKV